MNEPQDTRASVAETALREGRLDEALEALQADIRKKPQDKALRVFLFQLLAVNGAWERALRQLEASGLTRSQAIRVALLDAAGRLRDRAALAAEVAMLEADSEDREEMRSVADLMENLRAAW